MTQPQTPAILATTVAVMWLGTVGCGEPPLPTGPAETLRPVTHATHGWAMKVALGGRLAMKSTGISVDSVDGFRWTEIRWVDGPAEPAVAEWATETCDALVWDRPAQPIEGVRTQTGLCTRSGQQFWAILAVETYAARALVTTFLAHREQVPLEDAWADFVTCALSLTAGAEPLSVLGEAQARTLMREVAARTQGTVPIPGGGELGAAVAEELLPLWTARREAPPPDPLSDQVAPTP